MLNNKRIHQIKAVVITILLAMAILGAGAYGYINGDTAQASSSSSSNSGNSDYNNSKKQVNDLNQKLSTNPHDIPLQQDLGNAYYYLTTVSHKVAPNESKEDYILAIKYYQTVLNTKQDINVLTDMADRRDKEALTQRPDFQQALFNYGVFLSDVKEDYPSAIRMWQTAFKENLASAKPSGLGGRLSCAYASRTYVIESYTF